MAEVTTKQMADLQNIIDIQCSNGNWNYDAYMFGMANGLLLAKSVITGEDPQYLKAPEEWLADRPSPEPVEVAGGDGSATAHDSKSIEAKD